MVLSLSAFHILIVGFVALGSLTYGYCSSIISTTLGQPSFLAYFALDTRPNASQLEGAINGLFQAGGLFGSLSCIGSADMLGRKKAIFIAALVSLIGGALQAGSVHIAMYLVFRFITGLGVGALLALVPLYQSEIAPPQIRGFLVGTHGVMICIGYALASWIGLGFYFVDLPGSQWRLPLAIQCLPPLLLACGIFFLPESPRWLINSDQIEDALVAFKAIHTEPSASNADVSTSVMEEFNNLRSLIYQERQDKHTFADLFYDPSMRKRCLIGFCVLFACQGTATLVINNYGPSLYAGLGFSTVPQLLIQSGWISVCPIGNFLNSLIVDKIGRTRLLMAGFAGVIVALVGECISLSIYQKSGNSNTAAASAAVFFLFLHITCFSLTCDATSYIYASEIFPTPVRAKGLAVSVSGLFVATIIFLQCAPTAFAQIGWRYYTVFIACTAVSFVFVWLYCPETRQRSLEDIAHLFNQPEDLDNTTKKITEEVESV
ncbi:general substrate transporter [Talaromyces proteolyticus]|uniref:General substrate transporter n=1 Tax=Talaromyces proteolyticus TaxID=1131652 RepID=A0AAD4KWG2_9EURO|nr:general substrate transporter [Talaromyces proteolyticus]KAH8700743.1 general substrate transporter [Talaromyces proteolyticus]